MIRCDVLGLRISTGRDSTPVGCGRLAGLGLGFVPDDIPQPFRDGGGQRIGVLLALIHPEVAAEQGHLSVERRLEHDRGFRLDARDLPDRGPRAAHQVRKIAVQPESAPRR